MIITSGEKSSYIVVRGWAQAFFQKHIPARDAAILDVGCGQGEFLQQLESAGYTHLSGIEANTYPGIKKFAVTYKDISYEKLEWAEGGFDAITAWEVFEHLENPRFALRELHRILKPDGLFFISVPDVFSIEERLHFLRTGNFWRWGRKSDHYNIFTHNVFKKVFLKDFLLVEKRYPLPRFGKHGKLAKIPFRAPENELFGTFAVYILKKK
jgi:2-polyprenyl-3-methyl-5-hydroxy-6-metoxy-1,4-benzoquinol methylase